MKADQFVMKWVFLDIYSNFQLCIGGVNCLEDLKPTSVLTWQLSRGKNISHHFPLRTVSSHSGFYNNFSHVTTAFQYTSVPETGSLQFANWMTDIWQETLFCMNSTDFLEKKEIKIFSEKKRLLPSGNGHQQTWLDPLMIR